MKVSISVGGLFENIKNVKVTLRSQPQFSKSPPTQIVTFTSLYITLNIKNSLSQKLYITELTRKPQTNLMNINSPNRFKTLYCTTRFHGVLLVTLLRNLYLREIFRLRHSHACLIFVELPIKLNIFLMKLKQR